MAVQLYVCRIERLMGHPVCYGLHTGRFFTNCRLLNFTKWLRVGIRSFDLALWGNPPEAKRARERGLFFFKHQKLHETHLRWCFGHGRNVKLSPFINMSLARTSIIKFLDNAEAAENGSGAGLRKRLFFGKAKLDLNKLCESIYTNGNESLVSKAHSILANELYCRIMYSEGA